MDKVFLFALAFSLGCNSQAQEDLFTKGETLGKVNIRLEEASGLVASVNNEGYYWTHNDSGHPPEVFLIDEHAQIKLVCKLKKIKNRDWEDITVGPGPIEGKTYIYVGDIGDNNAKYPFKFIYRFEEPVISDQKEITISDFETLVVKLSDQVRDTEALTIDPISHNMFIFSKREDSMRLYEIGYPFSSDTLVANVIDKLPFHNINAADISADGREVLIKNYNSIYYWKREGDESLAKLFERKPNVLPYDNGPQDEAIAWKRDGSGFFVLGETVKKKGGELVLHKRK